MSYSDKTMSFVLRISAYGPPFGEFGMKWRPKNALIGPFGRCLERPGVSQVVAMKGTPVFDFIPELFSDEHRRKIWAWIKGVPDITRSRHMQ